MSRMLKKKDVSKLLSLSPASIDRYEKDARLDFPKRISIGNSRVGWWESEIMEWLSRRAQRPLDHSSE